MNMQEHLYDYDGKTKLMNQRGVHSSPGGRSVSLCVPTFGLDSIQLNLRKLIHVWLQHFGKIDYDVYDLVLADTGCSKQAYDEHKKKGPYMSIYPQWT